MNDQPCKGLTADEPFKGLFVFLFANPGFSPRARLGLELANAFDVIQNCIGFAQSLHPPLDARSVPSAIAGGCAAFSHVKVS